MEEGRTGVENVTVTREDQLTGDKGEETSQDGRLSDSERWVSVVE